MRHRDVVYLLLLLVSTTNAATAAEYEPAISTATEDAHEAIARFSTPKGMAVELFAAEPMLANPVAFCIDDHNRFYVAETFRHFAGVSDNRRHMYWLDEELASCTVEDRVALYKRHINNIEEWTKHHDRVRMIVDADGDGKADRATVFADGFNDLADGIGAGLLACDGNIWFTCIPHLWLLRDTDNDGAADVRKSLHYGYGVHVAFLGHDLHGLCMGNDGRLYFSIGDRGANIHTNDAHINLPHQGVVFRCNPDGGELEAFAAGLRNPQELAFDKHGNLFTVDNNSDSGDQARLVYVVEGGDSGWRMSFQYITEPVARGPWNAEKLWHPHFEGQAAYIVPPIKNISDGPSGLVYNPGVTMLRDRYHDHFFLADFRGDFGQSGIRSFAVRPNGASFKIDDHHQFFWSILATDVDFGADGRMYLLDWTQGWEQPLKGRIYRTWDRSRQDDPAVKQVQRFLAEGFSQRSTKQLTALLAHADARIRQRAQFALVEMDERDALTKVAGESSDQLARLHAVWGLGQLSRRGPGVLTSIASLWSDDDPEVRAQLAKIAGEAVDGVAVASELIKGLSDPEPRVCFFAALSLGRLRVAEAVDELVKMIASNNDRDVYLRHAGVMGLYGAADDAQLSKLSDHSSDAVRMAALLAMRRRKSAAVDTFLTDKSPRLVDEAARAINDVPIPEAMETLAKLVDSPSLSVVCGLRALNANYRLGAQHHANAVARLAARADVDEALRTEALKMLADWSEPQGRDRVVNLWRPLPSRDPKIARNAASSVIAQLLRDSSVSVRESATQLAGVLELSAVAQRLRTLSSDAGEPASVRNAALVSLDQLNDEGLSAAVRQAVNAGDPQVRAQGLRLLAKLSPDEAIPQFKRVLNQGEVAERKAAFETLGKMKGAEADELLADWMRRLASNDVPGEVQLELLDALKNRPSQNIKEQLRQFEDGLADQGAAARFRETLLGGDSQEGRNIFLYKAEVSCVRCHKIHGRGGEVGPDLTKIGLEKKREYLLEAIVDPNKEIAKGFETTMLALDDGTVQAGVLKQETDEHLRLITPQNTFIDIPKDRIEARKRGKSAMPEDVLKNLSRRELRDLIEWLATCHSWEE